MQEATTFNSLYDGISFQHLGTVLISVFTLCYGPGLLFVAHPVLQTKENQAVVIFIQMQQFLNHFM
jgi:hypothetical protein